MPILTPEERLGSKLAGKYRLDRILGRGGFGVVYAGVHEWTGREIATKVLKHELGQQENFVKRFLQEARAAAALNHPNVVDILDLGQGKDGTVFMVLELLEGRDLGQVIEEQGPLTPEDTFAYIVPVMDALASAHDKGIVHRDLKPDNIFLSVNSKGEMIPKLLDFGIAKMAGSGQTATSTGMIIGTPHYMAPEQARGLRDIGAPADVWSMGVVIWQCLSNQVPFDAGTPTGVIGAILTGHAPPFSSVKPDVPPHLAAAIDGALRADPAQRYPNMGAFIEALRGAGVHVAGTAPRPPSLQFQTAQPGSPRTTPAHSATPPTKMMQTPAPRTGPYTPHPMAAMTPPGSTPYAAPVEAPKSKSPLLLGVAAIAALGLAGALVAGAVVFWPSDEPVAADTPSSASPSSVDVDEPAPVPEAAPEVEATAEPAVQPEAPVAEAEPEEPTEEPEAEAEPAEEPEAVAASEPRRSGRRRRAAQAPRPQVRRLAPDPTPTTRPAAQPRPQSSAPRVGSHGAPILR